MISKKQLAAASAGALVTLGLGAGALTFAQTGTPSGTQHTRPHQPGVGGTVTAVSGNTITLTGRNGQTYTIDAGSASITKDMTVSVGDIKVGDTIMAAGTLSGTTLNAAQIHDGVPPMGMGGPMGHMRWGRYGSTTPQTGTGQSQ